jgi:hypothetical protein
MLRWTSAVQIIAKDPTLLSKTKYKLASGAYLQFTHEIQIMILSKKAKDLLSII